MDSLFSAAVLSVLLVGASALVHYEGLKSLNDALPGIRAVAPRAKVLLAVVGSMASHACQITLFAIAYDLLRNHFGLGTFGGHFKDQFTSFLYFSTETYTSLGLGDIYPTGALRMVTGIEALTGLVMISWTASFTYLEMRRYWK